MGDVELVLRFFAYRQRVKLQTGSLEKYLDLYLEHGNYFSSDVLESMKVLFEDTIKLCFDLLGEQAFFLFRNRKTGWSWYERPTTAVYDPLLFVLSQNLDKADNIRSNKEQIIKALPEFYKINYKEFEGRNTNPSALQSRDAKFSEFISRFV